jgi:1-acyl-sn-glycerol-3-phosphate acyltransferase
VNPGDWFDEVRQVRYNAAMRRETPEFHYPRRRVVRYVLRQLIHLAFAGLTKFRIIGQENLPDSGPLLVVANHFHYADPVAMARAVPWALEFVGGFQMPNAPASLTWLPKIWGYYPVRRSAVSGDAMRAAKTVLTNHGVLGIFPEGGSWASILRPPRPGTAFLAAETESPLLPIGIDGMVDIFPRLRWGKRATVTLRIGQPFGPFYATGKGQTRRPQLQGIGDEIMRRIAALIPPERRGHYSDDARLRDAARAAAVYPWDRKASS